MKKLLLILLCVPLIFSCKSQENNNAKIPSKNKDCETQIIFGDLTICLPEITGMIECYSDPFIKPNVDKMASINPGQIPIAVYVSDLVVATNESSSQNIHKYEGFEDYPFVNVYSFKQIQNQNITLTQVKDILSEIADKLVDLSHYDITELNKKMSNIDDNLLLQDKPVMLDRYSLHPQIESIIMLARYTIGDQEIDKLSILNYLLIENRLICYQYVDNYKGQETIDNLKMRNDSFGLNFIRENE